MAQTTGFQDEPDELLQLPERVGWKCSLVAAGYSTGHLEQLSSPLAHSVAFEEYPHAGSTS